MPARRNVHDFAFADPTTAEARSDVGHRLGARGKDTPMLVVRRRVRERIVFPHLRITLEVIEFRGRSVKIGINAPEDVLILRGEVASLPQFRRLAESPRSGAESHRLRNQLNAVRLGLGLIEKLNASGRTAEAREIYRQVLDQLTTIDREIGQQTKRVEQPVFTCDPGQLRLLLAEDDDNERELLAGLLRINGFRVETARNGQEAIASLQGRDLPDHVLLDLNMPDYSGIQALQAIRSDRRLAHLHVIAVSGQEPGSLGMPPGSGGFDGWFRKPLDPERLIVEMQRRPISSTCKTVSRP